MPLYIVPRTSAWLSEEERAAAADCLPAVLEHMEGGDVRFIRSYIVREQDGTFGAFCVYEATSPEAILAHSEGVMLRDQADRGDGHQRARSRADSRRLTERVRDARSATGRAPHDRDQPRRRARRPGRGRTPRRWPASAGCKTPAP
jgi:hypothetical protein